MIDPVIFSFKLLNLPVTLRWYGVLVMLGALVAAWIAERGVRRRGENSEVVWDVMVWALVFGILGARLWYVVNATLGGSTYYTTDPNALRNIINIPEGGLHIFGGFLFGVAAMYIYLKRNGYDLWLFLDAVAPAALVGQAIGRIANFINQELYGPPTTLPWGIPIEAAHRLPQFQSLPASTRFHPTFAYEAILNILAFLLLMYVFSRYEKQLKPGAMVGAWLIAAGSIRTFIEFFRPDQPRIGESFVTYSMAVSFLMAIAGVIMLMIRFGRLTPAFANGWEEKYQIKPVPVKKTRVKTLTSSPAALEESATTGRRAAVKEPAAKRAPAKKPAAKKTPAKKTPTVKRKPAAKK